MKIILVEKNDIVRELVEDWLKNEGHSIDLYLPNPHRRSDVNLYGNNEVLARLAPAYEALILDRETFGIDGVQFVDAVTRIIAARYDKRIIATTTRDVLTDQERARFRERVHWVDKPYQMRQLETELKRK